MEWIYVVVTMAAVAGGQLYHPVPLKETRHLQAIQQPHLPQDQNVLAATQQFLDRFAQLKALADAAPDPPANQKQRSATQQRNQHLHGQQIFAHNTLVGVHPQQQRQQQQHHRQLHPQQQPVLVVHHQPQQQQPHHHQRQASHQGPVPVVNHHGIVVNPNRYPGPLAHALPANVG